ncbi:MAG TPA: HD-GYP domain-containing protein, partial [Pirellulaceae bacterium]|nr:HD-GYP domain-containing protein [Pirellulaceae bacterium]
MAMIAASPPTIVVRSEPLAPSCQELLATLEQTFGVPLALWDGATGQCISLPSGQPNADDGWRGAMTRAVSEQAGPEIIADEEPFVILALPIPAQAKQPLVATGAFVVRPVNADDDLSSAARVLGIDPASALLWAKSQRVWPVDLLLRMAEATHARLKAEGQARRSAWEVEKISENLAATYEEICLLHEMANNLRLSQSDGELGQLALERLLTCVPGVGAAIQFLPVADPHDVTYKARIRSEFKMLGDCPIDEREFNRLIEHLELNAGCGPFVANLDITGRADWPFPNVKQLILTPLAETDKVFGWMAVFNHSDGDEFGSIEASLISSVGAILGIHCGNRDLYRLQDEFLASVVRAMTSAIDAKDPYTCGHSDRVARIAVRLAQELGFSTHELANIY